MLNENITKLRKSKGLTQVDFAKQLHVTQSAVSHWESGRSVPDTVQLFRIAEFFGVTVEALNVATEEPKKQSEPAKQNTPADKRTEGKNLLQIATDEEYEEFVNYMRYTLSKRKDGGQK